MTEILVIEDNALDAKQVMAKIKQTAIVSPKFLEAGTLANALEVLAEEKPDCVLLDLSLPDASGMDLVVEIVEAADSPVIVLTGSSDASLELDVLVAGCHDYVPKANLDSQVVEKAIRHSIARFEGEKRLLVAEKQIQLSKDRERIAMDLHDKVIQQLFAAGLGLQSVVAGTVGSTDKIETAVDLIDDAVKQLRMTVFGLKDSNSERDLGLALSRLVAQLTSEIEASCVVELKGNLSSVGDDVFEAAIAVVNEAVSNCIRHAKPTFIKVRVTEINSSLNIAVINDGASGTSPSPTQGHGNGLQNMESRAVDLGGEVQCGVEDDCFSVVWSVPVVK